MEPFIVGEGGLVPSASPLLPSVYMPRAEAPAVAAPAPLPAGTPDSLPSPPDLLAHVSRAAESALPREARQSCVAAPGTSVTFLPSQCGTSPKL